MYYSNNTIVRSCFHHAIVNVNSCIGAKLAFLRSLGVDIFKHTLCEAIQQVPLSRITVEQQADIENLRTLMSVRSEQSFIEGFDNTDIDCMIQYITGHLYYCWLLLVNYCLHCIFIDCHYIFYFLFSNPLYFLCSLLYHCV